MASNESPRNELPPQRRKLNEIVWGKLNPLREESSKQKRLLHERWKLEKLGSQKKLIRADVTLVIN